MSRYRVTKSDAETVIVEPFEAESIAAALTKVWPVARDDEDRGFIVQTEIGADWSNSLTYHGVKKA